MRSTPSPSDLYNPTKSRPPVPQPPPHRRLPQHGRGARGDYKRLLCIHSPQECFGVGCFWHETMIIIKIESHLFYSIICVWFPWRWRKKMFFWKKNQNGRLKNWFFHNRQFSILFCQNFRDWSLGLWDKLMQRPTDYRHPMKA